MCVAFAIYITSLIIITSDYVHTNPLLYEVYDTLRGDNECFLTTETCPNENITYYLYTKADPNTPIKLSVDDPDSIRNAKFVQGPIKFILHGYCGSKDDSPNKEIRPEYLKRPEDINVICIDYGPLVKENCYVESVKNSPVVANCTAQFLTHLLEIRKEIQLSQIHIVSFSLGTHVAGQISEYFSGGQIERITALDAALPMFIFLWKHRELDRGDAKFIDVLHTNGGMKGKLLPFGDVDFYANGGIFQPHCELTNTSCHHRFAPKLYAETINTSPHGFRAHKISFSSFFLGEDSSEENEEPGQYEVFGEYVNFQARGNYAFNTRTEAPYALPPKEQNEDS